MQGEKQNIGSKLWIVIFEENLPGEVSMYLILYFTARALPSENEIFSLKKNVSIDYTNPKLQQKSNLTYWLENDPFKVEKDRFQCI